jgi:flagellar hook-associated protein 2
MSTQPITTSGASSSDLLTSLGSGTPMQITGMASGLNTNAIVQALMSNDTQRVTNLQNQQSGVTALRTQLASIQSALQTVANDAKALAAPSLFQTTQTITSTNSTLIAATATSSNGAVVGGYQVAVSALASASQRSFSFTSPTADDSITIDGHTTSLAAGASAQDFVNSINSDTNATVWATVTASPTDGPATVVLSERATGAPSSAGSFVTVTDDAAGALQEQSQFAQAGQNAQYTINGVAGQSSTNTIGGAPDQDPNGPTSGAPGATVTIPGVSLSLNGLTPTGSPVSVIVGSPGANTQAVQTAIQQFVTDYNSALTQIQTQLSQAPSSSDPTQGTLNGDMSLQQVLSSMRQQLTAAVGGLSGSMKSMLDVGVSTGGTTGGGAPSQSAIAGNLTLDTGKLASALASNFGGVRSVLQSFSIRFSWMVNDVAAPGGTIDMRMRGESTQINSLASQISNLQAMNAQKQASLVQQFATMEAALSNNQSTASWLNSQISALPSWSSH